MYVLSIQYNLTWLKVDHVCSFCIGSVASSAPVFAKLDFPEYMDVVTASLQTTGDDCVKNIANATLILQSLLASETGAKHLTQMFK